MKFSKMFLILFVLSVLLCGAVSAQDLNDTSVSDFQDSNQIEDSNPVSSNGKSFTDLNKVIQDSDDVIDINENYTFDSQKDEEYKDGFLFLNGSFVINGNYNTIDAGNAATVFRINNAQLTINNLYIINANGSAISANQANLITNNVTFVDNHGNTGAVTLSKSIYNSSDDKFINNYANYGSAIYSTESEIYCVNDLFSSNRQINWALIYAEEDSEIYIENSDFLNTTSRYATAVYGNAKVRIVNSRFFNLYANYTAGAIGVKSNNELSIEKCEFVNVSSQKNGGAIFIDIWGNNFAPGQTVIAYCNFTDCYSGFGGAVLQLGGTMLVTHSNFINNIAEYSGGAIYSSNTTITSEYNNFISNKADFGGYGAFSGGAIFADNGEIYVEFCEFKNNAASSAGAIYLYDEYYQISDSKFYNNGEAIFSVFDWPKSFQKNNEFNGDTISLGNEFYNSNVFYSGKQIIFNTTIINANVSDTRFDLRDWNLVTPVKDQGSKGACSAFGAAAAFESAFLKATGITLDLSENNIMSSFLRYSIYGSNSLIESGYMGSGPAYFLSWLGPITTDYDSYDELGKISPIIFTDDNYHVQDVIRIVQSDRNALKEALINYGALNFFINGADGGSLPYYNENTSSLYVDNSSVKPNHFVALVGWDDSYSASNFNIVPPGDGAWICKNSWGDKWGDNGYFYVSYYDKVIQDYSASGIIFNNSEVYNKLYQYDTISYTDFYHIKGLSYRNYYVSGGDDLIAAVGTYFDGADEDYTITIYVGDESVYTQSGKSLRYGFETIKLDKLIPIGYNQKFSVDIKTDNVPVIRNARLHYQEGTSLAFYDGSYEDLSAEECVASIKVYTLPRAESQINITASDITFGEKLCVIANVTNNATGNVIFRINGRNYTESIVNGKAILNRVIPNLNVGSYDVVAFYEGDGYYDKSTSAPYNFQVSKANTTLEIVSKNKMLYVLFSSNATGVATVIIDDKDIIPATLSDSKIMIDLHGYADGSHNVSVSYDGDDNYFNNSANSSVDLKEVHSKMTIVMIDGLEITSVLVDSEGKPVSNVPVSYKINGLNESTTTTNDAGEFTVKAMNNCVLDMIFEGNYNVTGSNASITLKNILPVQKDTIIVVEKAFKRYAVDYNAGERGYKFYFTLTDSDGKVLSDKVVKIGVDGKIYNVKTDKDGKAGLMINLATSNFYTYGISFLGDDDYKASFAVSRLNVIKKTTTITPAKTSYSFKSTAKTKTITATLKSINSYIPSGKQVTLSIAGKTFKATIGAKGQISLNIGVFTKKGTYKVTIKFAGTGTYAASTSKTITVKIT